MKIRHIQPFALDKNIGKIYNQVISELPEGCWIVIRDQDTLPLRHDFGRQVHDLIEANPEYHAFTCMTNRLGIEEHCVPGMFDEPDINKHHDLAWSMDGTDVEPTLYCTGNCMIFNKDTWKKHKFKEDIFGGAFFDKVWSSRLRAYGLNIGIAKSIYLFHLYRWGKSDPVNWKQHLIPEFNAK